MLRHEEIAEKGSEKMREREAFLDRLRVMATLAVVMLHTATGVMDATDMSLYPLNNIFMPNALPPVVKNYIIEVRQDSSTVSNKHT